MKKFLLFILFVLPIVLRLEYAAESNPYSRTLNTVPQNMQAVNLVEVELQNLKTSQSQTLYYQPARMFCGEIPVGFIHELMEKSRTAVGGNGSLSIRDMVANDSIGTQFIITATCNKQRILIHTLLTLVRGLDGKRYLRSNI